MRFLLIIMMLVPSVSFAKEYKFKWIDGRNMLQYKTEANDWYTAFDKASDFCFKFFADRELTFNKARLEEVVDVCANPEKGSYDL